MLARGGLSLGDRLKICEELSLLLLCNCWTAKSQYGIGDWAFKDVCENLNPTGAQQDI